MTDIAQLIAQLHAVRGALLTVRNTLGTITLDDIDTHDLEALRDIHHSAGVYAEEVGTLLGTLNDSLDAMGDAAMDDVPDTSDDDIPF